MKLIIYNQEHNKSLKDFTMRVNFKSGLFILSHTFSEDPFCIADKSIMLGQDEQSPKDWYLLIHPENEKSAIPLRFIENQGYAFNSRSIARLLAESLNLSETSVKFYVSKALAEETGNCYAILTANPILRGSKKSKP